MAAEAAILNQSLSAGIYLVLSRFGSQPELYRHSDCLRTADLRIFREHSKASASTGYKAKPMRPSTN